MKPSFLDKNLPARLAPFAVLLLGLSLTFLVWNSSTEAARKIQQDKFEFRVNQIVAGISQRLRSYEQVLLGSSGLFAASVSVEREEFRDYIAKLRLEDNFPGIQGVGFSLRIPAMEKQRHLEKIHGEGFPDYTLRPEGQRDPYSAIVYLEPFDWRNQRAFGFDMYSEPVRRAAMDAAWETGVSAISGKVKLIQETGQDVQWGFLMYVPVYRNGTAVDSVAARRANLLGWAYAPFRMNDLMRGILGKEYGEAQPSLRLEIFDGALPSIEARMFDSNPQNQGNASAESLHASRQIEFGMHSWTVAVHSLARFEMQETRSRLMVIGYAGVAISLLMAFAAWLLLSGRARALALAEKMAAKYQEVSRLQQAILDSASHIIISTDDAGTIRTFNTAAERLLGYRGEEIIGKATPAIFHDTREVAKHAETLKRELGRPVQAGFEVFVAKVRADAADENEWTYIRKDGSHFPVMLSVTALTDSSGKISGYLGVAQNIEESKRARQELLKLSRAIEQSPVSVLITDTHGTIEYVNPKFCQVSGYSPEELIGQNPKILNSGNNSRETYQKLWSTIRSGVEWQGELLNRKKNGELFWEKLVLSALRNEEGEITSFVGVKEDITAQKAAERDIQRFKNILDNTLDMIFMFDPDTLCFVYLNKGAMESLGYTREELIGRPVWEIKPHMPEAVFRSFIAPLLQGEKPWLNYETVHLSKDGTELPVEVFLQLVEEGEGKRLFVAISRDLTERRKIDKMKSEFISTVSHELRTPLTSIRGSLGLLRGGVAGELPPQIKPMIEIAYSNAERLVRLINDILDMEKIESGKMRFDLKTVELLPLIEQSLAANHGYGEQHQVRFALGATLPGAWVNVDTDRLSQVLANLLSNAAKFSPPGDEVTVSVKESGPLLRVEVSDHGSGIPEEFRARIFQKFSQADSSDTKQKGGTGLGLSITKAIVEKMGGNIGFVSEAAGRGTTFFFELPRAAQTEGGPGEASAPPCVLVCEDDAVFSRQLKEMLERRGYCVDVAASAEEAKQFLAQRDYIAMTLDIMLPGQDGLSLMRELQNIPATASLPIVMVSAHASMERERTDDGLTVLDWLDKPVNPERLFAVLREQSRLAGRHPAILHVEDDPDIRQVLKVLIGDKGEVVSANSLAMARTLLESRHFDLVVLDIGLPDGSGLDILPYLAKRELSMPVILFSATEVGSDVAREVCAALVKSRTSNQQLLETIMGLIVKHE
jgi:PAS domain S-box-containing protein